MTSRNPPAVPMALLLTAALTGVAAVSPERCCGCRAAAYKALESRRDVLDFVIVGDASANARIQRVPGSTNGAFTVVFRDVPGAHVEITLDGCGPQKYSCIEKRHDSLRTVTVGGVDGQIPSISSIALVRGVRRRGSPKGDAASADCDRVRKTLPEGDKVKGVAKP